jgi:predicted Fe-Mo cluster-binding NifX family protein
MIIAIPTSNGKTVCEYIPFCKYFLIIDTKKNERKLIDNPMFEKVKNEHIKKRECGENALHTGQFLPTFLKNLNVDILIAKKLGEGMLDNLEIVRIKYKITDKKNIDEVIQLLA